jgi:hypothetical protein
MNEYHITEVDPYGFTDTWNIKAKNLTSAKRQASRAQVYINTTLSIYLIDTECPDCLIPIATKGPVERIDSKWEDIYD